MFGRSLATVLGLIGGILVILGGVVEFLMAVAGGFSGGSFAQVWGVLVPMLLAGTLGLFILLSSRPRIWWWPGRRMFNSIVLIFLGVLAWVLIAGSVLVEFGAVFAILAGVVLPLEGLVAGAFGRGSWLFRRRWF
ncbi:MAG TPA: hypothetical protein VGV89_04805 [Thermoplasmata archaeon]|nr:hypothetical protein [Thermoplasmata archaeon]